MNKKYIKFKLIEEKPKTNVYLVCKTDGNELGKIYWHCTWRQYVFEPYEDTIWSLGCLQHICEFLKGLKKDKKLEVLE